MNADRPIAIQLKTIYLPWSETFVFRHLTRLRRWRPYVFAEQLEHLDRFPLESIGRLERPALWRRASFGLLRRLSRDETLRANFRPGPTLANMLPDARLLHAHFGESGIAALPIKRQSGLPLITSFHGRDVAKPAARPYGRILYRRLFQQGAAFIAISQRMRADLIGLGARSDQVQVIRTGIDPDEIPFVIRRWPADGAVRLLTSGRMVEKKGMRYAIEAVARLHLRYPKLSLTVIGDGPLRPALERQAEVSGVARQVRFLGAQPVERVIAEMLDSQIFLLPCVTAADGDQEGLPVVLMEAQASGMPVVSSHHAGISEVVCAGSSGYLAAERDVDQLAALLVSLLEHPERWPEMGAAGRRQILAEFDVNQAAARIEALYDAVTVETRPRRTI
jgi:colanic acid/amylovoran biosynthesis glycosyltransferase